MSFGSSIAGLFGRSPIKPLQQHYDTVHDCARTLADFFAAVTDNDWDKARAARKRIAELEEYIAEGEAIVEPPRGNAGADDVGAVRIPTAAAASEEMDEHAAATRIQAMHRGRVAREEVQVKKLASGALDSVTQGDGS